MWKVKVVLLVWTVASLTGCGLVSLHPLAMPNDKEAVFDPALLGTWEEVSPAKTRYVVARAESGYTVHVSPEEAKGGDLTMHLLKVGDRYLLDVYCPSDGPPPPVHLFFRLRLDKDAAWLAGMQSKWLIEQIKTRGLLRHEVLMAEPGHWKDNERIVLTASTAELRRYLRPSRGRPIIR